jgi:glycosyltransferase involved in cell wall biosynthesis
MDNIDSQLPRGPVPGNDVDEGRKLRILTVMNCSRGIAGGMAVHCAMLSKELTGQGHRVENLFLEDVPRWVERRGPNYTLFAPLIVRKIRRIEEHCAPFDVIQISGGDGFLAPLLRRDRDGRRRLVVARSHGLEHLYWAAYRAEVSAGYEHCSVQHRLFFGGLRLCEVEQSIRAADLLICHTPEEREYVATRGWKRESQIALGQFGIPAKWLDSPMGILPRNRILWSGSWVWTKGRRVLVEVFSRLARAEPSLTLTIVGSGVGADIVLARFPEAVRSRITVRPSVSHEDMPELFRSHSLLLATSPYEGFGGVVVEAMATGLPVVVSSAGGWPRYVRTGETGVLVESWDPDGFVAASRWVLDLADDELRVMRTRAREAVSGLTWSDQASRLARQFDESLSRLVQ